MERSLSQKKQKLWEEILSRYSALTANNVSADHAYISPGFAHAPAVLFRGFLIVGVAFHISDQTFFFAHLLEAPDHLLY